MNDEHYLQQNAGEPIIYWDGSSGELGFSILMTPTGSDGFTEGDDIGVTDFDPSSPFPDGAQGFGIEDADGVFTVEFQTVDLTVRDSPTVELSLFVSETGWEQSDWFLVFVETDTSTIVLFDSQGQDLDNMGVEGLWQTF